MGEHKADECIFCERQLEESYYGHFQENGERAGKENDWENEMNICKRCLKKLKFLLCTKDEGENNGN